MKVKGQGQIPRSNSSVFRYTVRTLAVYTVYTASVRPVYTLTTLKFGLGSRGREVEK